LNGFFILIFIDDFLFLYVMILVLIYFVVIFINFVDTLGLQNVMSTTIIMLNPNIPESVEIKN